MRNKDKWTELDFSVAMQNAIQMHANPRLISKRNEKILFNGFWREGDKQNLCLWANKATWHDAKTNNGGGCKEFAQIAFNMSLPEFMDRFGGHFFPQKIPSKSLLKRPMELAKSINIIWTQLQKKDSVRSDNAAAWLSEHRGFEKPRLFIGSGFSNLDGDDLCLFEPHHHSLIRHRISLGPQLVVPIRSIHSENVQNLFIRAISDVPHGEKSRLLTGAGGWSDLDGSPRAFGFPHLINDFSSLILCEGMADYFAVECLLACSSSFLAIGASNAGGLKTWATWLSVSKYQGEVIILYQLDSDSSGNISIQGIGQSKASEALKILRENNISCSLFRWPSFLRLTKAYEHRPSDIADVCKFLGSKTISESFIKTLKGEE